MVRDRDRRVACRRPERWTQEAHHSTSTASERAEEPSAFYISNKSFSKSYTKSGRRTNWSSRYSIVEIVRLATSDFMLSTLVARAALGFQATGACLPRAAPGALQAPRVRSPRCIDLEEWEDWWEDGLTCVEFTGSSGEKQLGVYVAYSVMESEPHIRPLCASCEEDGVSALLCDEDAPIAPLTAVCKVLDPDYVFVSERQAGGGQGLGNPHGEHGEECYVRASGI